MKNKKLGMLVKASILSRKGATIFFCCFMVIATILVLVSAGAVMPLKNNIDQNINNHILNRELNFEINENTPQNEIDDTILSIKSIEHITNVYNVPAELDVKETSGVLFSDYTLSYVHEGYNLKITSGRAFKENEENVAVVPETLKDFNSESQRINKIDGKTLVGKNLVFADESGKEHKLKIVGVYNTSDPIFTGNQILIPRNSLIEFNNEVIANAKGMASITSDKAYKILVDDAKNLESVQSEVSSYCEPYTMDLNFDSQSYNIALIIIIGSIVFFALFVIAGQYMFVKSNISRRTEELALYRSLGYKSNQLFYIIFAEYFLIGIISIAVGTILTVLLDILLINPYLMNLVGNTMMEMTVNVSAVYVLLFLVIYLIVLAIVSIWAVKRSEKTDLSVLLRER